MKLFLLTLLSFLLSAKPTGLLAQDPGSINSKCQQALSAIDTKMRALNAEYENIKEDLKAGLFCSLCGNSKTELDKTEGFYKHLKNVKGEAVAADQKQMNAAHDRYQSKFNSLKSQYESKQKSCNEDYNRAVTQQYQKAEQDKQDAMQKQQDRIREAQAAANRQKLAEEQRLQQVQQQLRQQQEENRQRIVAESEKNKQDAVQMFGDAADRLTNSIRSINLPSERIGFEGKAGNAIRQYQEDRSKPLPHSVDDYDFDNSTLINNYLEQYSTQVESIGKKEIISSSQLPDIVKKGYDAVKKYANYGKAAMAALDGTITKETVDSYFSSTPNAVIKEIQKYSGAVAVKNANSITDLTERMFEDDFSEKDIYRAVNSMNPLHLLPTAKNKPLTMKDAIVVIGGGALLSTVGAPVWLGIGAAAWYGFNR